MAFKIGVGLFTGQIPAGGNRPLHDEYLGAVELTRLTEAEGLDSSWVSEHHGAGDGYLPSLLPMLAAFATVTSRIELGTGVVLAPFHDPLRMAEDFAVVDQLSGGRTIAGFGIGWRDEEFRAFGIETSSRVRRTIELVEILRRAWSEERFSFEGKYFNYDRVAVTPKPARRASDLRRRVRRLCDPARRPHRRRIHLVARRPPACRGVVRDGDRSTTRCREGGSSPRRRSYRTRS